METLLNSVRSDLAIIRAKSPIILNLTNYVAMDLTANSLLAIGASPIMAHAEEELEELVDLASAVVINIGTLDLDWTRRMAVAVNLAGERKKPVIFDPVGAGATRFRTAFARDLLGSGYVSTVRGNASEVAALLGSTSGTHGVDSAIPPEGATEFAKMATRDSSVVVTISGATDYIISRNRTAKVENGDSMMTRVTAMGCTATAIIAAFSAVNPSAFYSATHAMATMGLAGERAARLASGPGSFRSHFLDQLGQLETATSDELKVSIE